MIGCSDRPDEEGIATFEMDSHRVKVDQLQ
jgi:hypothetical protein